MKSSTHSPRPVQRVCLISVHTCPLAMLGGKKTGGMNVYVRDFASELGRRGVHVDVFTRSQDDCVPRIVHDLGPTARVIHIPAGPEQPIPVPEVVDHIDQFVDGVAAFASREGIRYDLIHSHYWLSGLVAEALIKRWGKLPILQMFHTLGHMKNKIATNEAQRSPQSRIDGETHIIHNVADALIAATPAEQQQLIELYDADAAKIDIIPPGVDFGRFARIPKQVAKKRVGLEQYERNILLAGRIEPLKGIDTLLKAVARVADYCSEALLNTSVTIVGGDPWADDLDQEMARLQELRTELGITDLVTFVGSKDQMMLPNYYAASDIVIMPSHYESFGLVALEAMAMGTPVIASEVGGLAHLVIDGETGFHMPSRDDESLARKIHELLLDEPLRQQLADNARAHAQKYAWPLIVDQMLVLYCGLLNPTEGERHITPFQFVRDHPYTDATLPVSRSSRPPADCFQ